MEFTSDYVDLVNAGRPDLVRELNDVWTDIPRINELCKHVVNDELLGNCQSSPKNVFLLEDLQSRNWDAYDCVI